MKVVIVDYGLGNLASIKNMIKKIGFESIITDDINEIKTANKLILPGVGNFKRGMEMLNQKDLIETLNTMVLESNIPILGICLGMQLMTNYSDEGNTVGLKWINAETTKFNLKDQSLKIPHMGWADVYFQNNEMLNNIFNEIPRFYFVHSYKVNCNNPEDVLGISLHEDEFHSAFKKNNIVGVQFHPEKSHKFGMNFINYFLTHQN